VERKRFGEASYFNKAGKYAPTKEEMQAELRKYLQMHPQRTEVQQLFDAEGWTLVYTPPYTPTTQPIETVWGYVKNYVARKYENGRKMEVLRQQTLDGMYGNPSDNHEGVTAAFCQSVIDRCHRWSNSFIEADSELGGTVEALTGNPDMEIPDIDLDEDEENEADPFAGEAAESDAEDEPQ
jgi:hypothetical protein